MPSLFVFDKSSLKYNTPTSATIIKFKMVTVRTCPRLFTSTSSKNL